MAKHRFPWERRVYRCEGWAGTLPCERLILSLCDRSGEWPAPYAAAGYPVECIDLADGGGDVRDVTLDAVGRILRRRDLRGVYGVLSAPPCNKFSQFGRNMNGAPSLEALRDAVAVADACVRLSLSLRPVFWALENPAGRLREYLGAPVCSFHPADFGGYLAPGEAANGVERDAYRKRTLLWGSFNPPRPRPVEPIKYPTGASWTSDTPRHLRSVTPRGFSRAFMEANP